MPPGAEAARPAILANGEDVGMRIDQPFGRCGRGSAEDDLQPLPRERVDGAVQPVEMELAARGFQTAPGELADPHAAEAEAGHLPRILGPARLRPMFGIVADAQMHDGCLCARAGMR